MILGESTSLVVARRVEAPKHSAPRTVPMPPSGHDRRLENWIAGNLDFEPTAERGNYWNRMIGNLPGVVRNKPKAPRAEGTNVASLGGWPRFKVAYRRGITLVRLVDQSLVRPALINELGSDLMDLIEVGNHRLILNFRGVEKLGSWIIGVVGKAYQACKAAGGKLKICGLDPQLAEIFAIAGMSKQIELQPDEAAAIESPWPPSLTGRQLPVDLLSALVAIGEVPPLRGGSPDSQVEFDLVDLTGMEPAPIPVSASPAPDILALASAKRSVALQLELPSGETRAVAVSSPQWLIGRDRPCQLRLNSAQVSKQHAAIEQRDDRVFLKDLASTNGTIVNGTKIKDGGVELHHEDLIQFGPIRATVVFSQAPSTSAAAQTSLPTQLDDRSEPSSDGLPPATEEVSQLDEAELATRIRCEIMQDVLIVTPLGSELTEETVLEAVRDKLHELLEQTPHRRVVVNLEYANHVSRQAIAILLAHHFRLEWAGGSLRICQAHARIIAMLDQVRLTMLIDCYPTLDEAVLAPWTKGPANS